MSDVPTYYVLPTNFDQVARLLTTAVEHELPFQVWINCVDSPMFGDSLRPLVKTHPETQRKALILGRHAYGIVGMAEDESEALLQELADFACQPPRIYHHQWGPGDAVVWDNRCLMHRATPWLMQEPRIMYHARIAGDQLSEFAAHA